MNIVSSEKIVLTMIDRETKWLKKYINFFGERKFAIFASGFYGRKFYYWLLNDYGVEAEFFIDNNPKFTGQTACGKPIMLNPWNNIANFKEDYFVLISTCDTYYRQIAKQLDEVGVPYLSSDAFQVSHLWKRFKKIIELFDDSFSVMSYLAVLWYWLTYDNIFVQTIENQYFAIKEFSSPIKEIIADIGAFVGDTTEEYLKRALGDCTIYAFEPDGKLLKALAARVKRLETEWALSDNSIKIIPVGIGSKTGDANFTNTGSQDAHITLSDEDGKKIKIYALDDYFSDKQAPTVIKADIEGAELDMLSGAENIIKKYRPKLALCIYHSISDYIKIPEYILTLNPEYRMAVRNHSKNSSETVLYCY